MFPELVEWILGLDRQFAFLLSLPFLVAFAGLLSEGVRQRKSRHDSRGARSTITPHNRPSFNG